MAFVVLAMAATAAAMAGAEDSGFSPYVDAAGAITLPDPDTVRRQWSFLGTWAVQGDGGVSEFHAVYTQPGTIEAFRRTGAFADGTVLVKEVRKAVQASMTTGEVARSGGEVLWFVMVADRKGRFPGNPIWAERWGWALFLAADRSKNTATDFRDDCMACHEPARQTGWVFTEGYPALHD